MNFMIDFAVSDVAVTTAEAGGSGVGLRRRCYLSLPGGSSCSSSWSYDYKNTGRCIGARN